MRIANAPCSWGVLEFESAAAAPSATQVLDEIAATGYAGTELGDWGFLSTEARQLAGDLGRRKLALVGAFVDVALTDPAAHDAGEATAVRTARLLADAVRLKPDTTDDIAVGGERGPMIVLSDATARVPSRTAKA